MVNKKNSYSELFDSIIIGTGPCSEPVLFHLKNTDLNCCIIDSGDLQINKSLGKLNNRLINIRSLTPKYRLKNFMYTAKNYFSKINNFLFIKCKNFIFVYSFYSGGLSNVWGGGAFEWPDWELKKTSNLKVEFIKDSYKSIRNRLLIKKYSKFASMSEISKILISRNKFKRIFFRSAEFFLNKEVNKNDKYIKFNQNLIWNSSFTIKKYIDNSKNLNYKKNTCALSIKPINNEFWEIKCLRNNKFIFLKTKSIILCAGTISSASLAFSATNMDSLELNLKHNHAAIVPILNLNSISKKVDENLELPELAWNSNINNENIEKKDLISGYYLNSSFLSKDIISKLFFLKVFSFHQRIKKLLSRIGFITIFFSSEISNVSIFLKKGVKENEHKPIYLEVKNLTRKKSLNRYLIKVLLHIQEYLPNKLYLLKYMRKLTSPGGDVHYSSTLPEEIGSKRIIFTNKIGEVSNLPGIFSCDPSRLAYLSSLPHTFTTMAIVDASMPDIIKKIKKI